MLLIERKSRSCLFIVLFFSLFPSCNGQEYIFKDVKSLKATHKISHNIINQILIEMKDNERVFDTSSNTLVLYFHKKKKTIYKVSTTKTDFELFKENKSDYYFSKIRGYLMYEDLLVLLYGYVYDIFLERVDEVELKNIMYQKNKDEAYPPIIYEPTFIEYNIENGKLVN